MRDGNFIRERKSNTVVEWNGLVRENREDNVFDSITFTT